MLRPIPSKNWRVSPAFAPARSASRLKPSAQDLEFLTSKADTLLTEGRLVDAKDEYVFILQQEPTWAPAHYGMARVLEAQSNAKGACAEYRKYLELAPAGKYTIAAGRKAGSCK